MLTVSNLSLQFGKRVLFDEVNIKFTRGNCYGVIGANGAGKSTFLKILSGEIESTLGHVAKEPDARMTVLKQDHFAYDEYTVLDTVMMGHEKLYNTKVELDNIYLKEDFSDADGVRAGELNELFEEMGGWNAESDAAMLLSNLGVVEADHFKKMEELNTNQKVRVLLAQVLYGNPDILILDEPTNDLDAETIMWLEDFLADFKNTVIVVSHDRHFLDAVCTHIVDVDHKKIKLSTGNYTFWYQTSQLLSRQMADKNKKNEQKRKELMDFIQRFSANASKAKQATSRKKALEKLDLNEISVSSRRYPGIIFKQNREIGNQVLTVNSLKKVLGDTVLFDNLNFTVEKGDKIAVRSKNSLAVTKLFQVLAGEEGETQDSGDFEWGVTVTKSYLPNENAKYFNSDLDLVDWLRQYSEEKDETFIRGFLGRMLFSGEETQKSCNVLSGGEKVRCLMSKIMLEEGNVLILDEPTSHLDLESITKLNEALIDYPGIVIFTSHDHEFTQTVANRIIEIGPNGMLDKLMTYDEYLQDEKVKNQREELYKGTVYAS
ncbi:MULTISPECIES: ABC-F family ATP-binding cassette domain-containing protein [unclassified Aureispira]|uniref:ABC-F family ATP-binding cassette domain-containing protein n=1 Tax=unclassified Aureispira TaxID=2649989 RepID=UPI0006976CA8|nr:MULTISPECIES: ATP-binding cassette domain-containing protein [unclassified Aureispira]WMX12825.1 ATP-binding cassette domain-containing protein [Aureispira sp. CCB-E]